MHLLAVVFFATLLLIPSPGYGWEAHQYVEVEVTLRNRIAPDDVVQMDCMLNDSPIDPKGFLMAAGMAIKISEWLSLDDNIYCDFSLGYVPRDLIQVTVECTTNGDCNPRSLDFTNQGVYYNTPSWSQPEGLPDQSWSTLLPHLPPS